MFWKYSIEYFVKLLERHTYAVEAFQVGPRMTLIFPSQENQLDLESSTEEIY